MKLHLRKALFFFFIILTVATTFANEVNVFVGTRTGYEQNVSEEKRIRLRCIDVVKTKEGYQVLGVMMYPDKKIYIWKGNGQIENGRLYIEYNGIVGDTSGTATLYYTKEGYAELLFNDKKFEVFETP